MRTIILRSFFLAIFGLLFLQDSQAQRGRYNNRRVYRSYNSYYHPRTVISFSSPRVLIPFGGMNYYYSRGYYYRSYGSAFRIIAPPIGININILPRSYRQVYVGDVPYYYYGGVYYKKGKKKNTYEVVEAPLGASVPELPEGAEVVVINNQKFYEMNGTYYKEEIKDNSEIWYTVVGRDGKLNTDETVLEEEDKGPVVGDIVDKLPNDCRTVVVGGVKYFVSPDGVYYEEIMQQNTLKYKVSGK